MEKKGNRNAPNTSRGSSGTDLKKNADVTTGKQGSRAAPRRREPPCGFAKANESGRKPQPQRNTKSCDKRPKPRGLYYSGALPRNEETGLEFYEEPELGSVFSPGSKKQSLNHLLNFSFVSRDTYPNRYQHQRSGSKDAGKLITTRKHKYNKEHFLQANCQFIVNENGDYKQYLNNPDVLVDWNLIEEVNVQVNEEPSCPICLYPPVAAKMTKCGHVYCWPCILHYLALSDKDWRKCPICYDAVKKDDLKSVKAIPHKTFNINDTITFKLMKRQRGSLTVYPAEAEVNAKCDMFNISNKTNHFSKLFLCTSGDILNILDRENSELEFLMAEDETCPERCFMDEAQRLLNIRRNGVLIQNKEEDKVFEEVVEEISDNCEGASAVEEKLEGVEGVEGETGGQQQKFFYFYQAEDGQHIYLHAINAKMLEHTFGSLEFGPKTLSGRILEKEGGSMTEELRKKLRYLQHLPVTCQFEVAEIHIGQSVISKETLDFFKDQVELRKRRRQRRAKEEKKREKWIETEENRKIGKYVTPELNLESRDHFPDVIQAHDMFPDYLDNRIRTESESTLLTTSERSLSPDLVSSISNISLDNESSGPSFAMMLATEKKPSWPALKRSTNQSSSTPVKLINVTGSSMSTTRIQRRHSDSDQEQVEDYEPVPDFNRSFGDALAEALAKGLGDNESNDASTSGKKKKKKNKQKLLFSTHMAFPGN